MSTPGPYAAQVGFKTGPLPPPLRDDERGIVIAHQVIQGSGDNLSIVTGIDPHQLRLSLLLWDKINQAELGDGDNVGHPDQEFLEQEGILNSTPIIRPDYLHDQLALTDVGALSYLALDERDEGRWAMASAPNSIRLAKNFEDKERGVLVELHRAIPVPDGDVALEDILEFRQRRRPELLRLRDALSDLYLEIDSAVDKNFATTHVFSKLDRSLAEYMAAAREAPFRKVLGSLAESISIDPKALFIAASAAAAAATSVAITPLGALGIVGSGIAISMGPGLLGVGKKRVNSPYEYVHKIHTELPSF